MSMIDIWARYDEDRFGRVVKLDVGNTGMMVSVAGTSNMTHLSDPPDGQRHITDDRTRAKSWLPPVEPHSETTLRLVDTVAVPDANDPRLTLDEQPPAGALVVPGPGIVHQVFGREPEISKLTEEWSQRIPSGLSFRVDDGPMPETFVAVLYDPSGKPWP